MECDGDTWTREGRCKACLVFPTLGHAVARFIEANCAIPDGDHVGEPFMLTDEQYRFLLNFYRLDPATKWKVDKKDPRGSGWVLPFVYYRGAQLVRPQKWGKGPFAAAIVCAEAVGPVRFDGWDENGHPVGKPWETPLEQITAVSEDQAANVWRMLVPMIQLGSIAADVPDTGQTRINLPGGGRIEPVTSSARSRLGQPITFAVQDETHSWLERNGGLLLADNQRRNLEGMQGRFLEITNAWDPRENSVAQKTAESGEPGVYRDDVDPGPGSVRNKADRRRMLKKVFGDSWWVDLDRIDGGIQALLARGEGAQAERFFLNRKLAGEDAAFDGDRWDDLAVKPHLDADPKAVQVVGVDGARIDDCLAVIATQVVTGYQWVVGIWSRPADAGPDYEHPLGEVDATMVQHLKDFPNTWRVYVDPGYSGGSGNIMPLLEKWQGRWGEKRIVPWEMTGQRNRQVTKAVANLAEAIISGEISHDGDETFTAHVKNARRKMVNVFDENGRRMSTVSKDRPGSPRKIDAACAAILSWEARGDCIAAGEDEAKSNRTFSFT